MNQLPIGLFAASLVMLACGAEEDSSGDSNGCEEVPECYISAQLAVQDCVTSSELELGSVRIRSGVAQGVSCSADELVVTFSDFGGSVPTPTGLTLTQSGEQCAEIKRGKGSLTREGVSRTYESSRFIIPGQSTVTLSRFEDGALRIECGVENTFDFAAGNLDACPKQTAFAEITREGSVAQDNISSMGLSFSDASGEQEVVFTCE